jgi:hypothetical protein
LYWTAGFQPAPGRNLAALYKREIFAKFIAQLLYIKCHLITTGGQAGSLRSNAIKMFTNYELPI